jgi:predicted PurR-regulated permease PerM
MFWNRWTSLLWGALFLPLFVLAVWLVRPFWSGTVWGVLLAIAMYPLFEGVAHHRRFRLAAGVSALVLLSILSFMAFSVHELIDAARFLVPLWKQESAQRWPLPGFVQDIPFFHAQISSLWDLVTLLVSKPLAHWPDKIPVALSLLRGAGGVVSGILVAIFVFFFALKDSPRADALLQDLRILHPWIPATLQVGIATLRAMVWSVFLGVLGEVLSLWAVYGFSGVPHPFVLALFCALVAIIPIAGTIAVISVGGWVLFTKGWIGLVVIVLGLVVLGTADNYAKPVLAKLVDPSQSTPGIFWILVGMLSGVTTLGVVGVFIGPSIFAMLIYVLGLLRDGRIPGVIEPNANSDAYF